MILIVFIMKTLIRMKTLMGMKTLISMLMMTNIEKLEALEDYLKSLTEIITNQH